MTLASRCRFFILAIAISGCSSFSLAQSISLIGNSGYAQMCFEASTVAARSQIASFQDLQICTKAIDHQLLHRRDLIATYVNRGIIYASLERYDSASADYEKAMSMDDSTAAVYLNRGNLWFVSRNFGKAIEDYTKSLELELNQRHVALLNRGMAHESRGELLAAERDYQASLLVRPDWREATTRLERVERKLSN